MNGTISEAQIKVIAEKIRMETYQTLISATDVPRILAMQAAQDAADRFALGLGISLALSDVNITKE